LKKIPLSIFLLLKCTLFLGLFILVGFNIIQHMDNHAEFKKVHMNIVDFYNSLFLNTQNTKIDYVDFKSFKTLLGIVTIIIIGTIYVSSNVFSLNKRRLYLVILRYKNINSFLLNMQAITLKKSFIYSFILNSILLITIFAFNDSILYSISDYANLSNKDIIMLILTYAITFALFIFTISKIIIYAYILKGSNFSIIFGLVIPIIILMIDINFKPFNVILFDYHLFFVDSLIIIIGLNFLISLIGRNLINKYDLYS